MGKIHSPIWPPRATQCRFSISLGLVVVSLLIGVTTAAAIPIAHWDFNDGTTDDTVGLYDLTAVGGGPAISGGYASFDGDESSPSFLETSGWGGNREWSIGLRIRAHDPHDQGIFQGILSNNSSSTANYSWQVENSDGRYLFRTLNAVYDIGAPTGGWDTIVVRKVGGNDGDIWFNGVQVVSSFGSNPGGLQNFRLGTNRNSNSFYGFDADWVQIWNSYEDPATVPEPGTAMLLGLGLGLLARRRG